MAELRLTFLSGIGNIGGSILHISDSKNEDDGGLIDAGSDMARESQLFGGFVRPRDSRGISDQLQLGLIPRIHDVWRADAITDPDLLRGGRRLPTSGAAVSHAHGDHAKLVAALSGELELHMSRVTAAFLHNTWKTGEGLFRETTHYVEREPHPTEVDLVRKPRGGEIIARPIGLLDGPPSKAMIDMWCRTGASGGLQRSSLKLGGIDFRFHALDHSIWGAGGFSFETAIGSLWHLADFRTHGTDGDKTRTTMRRMIKEGAKVFVCEGTRITMPCDEPQVTEAECRLTIRHLVRKAGRRLVIGSVAPRHLERLAAFIAAAQDSGRQLLLPASAVALLEAIEAADPFYRFLYLGGIGIYDPSVDRRDPWHQDIRQRYTALLVHPEQVKGDPHKYIVMYGFGQSLNLLDLEPHGALLIWSNSADYTGDARLRSQKLGNWVRHYGIETKGIEFRQSGAIFDTSLNPSGHCHPRELRRLIERLKPEFLIPVHTTSPRAFLEFAPKGTEVIMPTNGRTIKLPG